ncbi:hypothetical protein POL82_27900 [Priestia aryabhattai]|uniref:hypothetical protein n=1 Tax=Priestia aryabhattai TaxID=412384 RepID=UPI00234E7793|nr:hypothetical protein [Priestia aryabhattai]MDC7767289.1 hypothetical protein [Priestia aryabhattai]
MKKTIHDFINKTISIIITFAITLFTAIISSNNTNNVYNFLNRHGYSDPTIQKVILSAIIAAAIALLQAVLGLLYKAVLWIIKSYFARSTVEVNFRINNENEESIKFEPVGGEYEEKQVEIELKVIPAGKISIFIFKLLKLQMEIFFNPQIIDITLLNDQEWLNQNASTRISDNESICINVLNNYRLGGFSMRPYTMTENIVILPKRIKRDTAYIDFRVTSAIGSGICIALCDPNMKELNIECEGGK